MQGHPIEGLMKTAMESMVDVNTILGDRWNPDGSVIIPVSKSHSGLRGSGCGQQNGQKQ